MLTQIMVRSTNLFQIQQNNIPSKVHTMKELFDFSSFHWCAEVYSICYDEFVAISHKLSEAFQGTCQTSMTEIYA